VYCKEVTSFLHQVQDDFFVCSLSMDSSITVGFNVGHICIQCVVLNGFNSLLLCYNLVPLHLYQVCFSIRIHAFIVQTCNLGAIVQLHL
jgi:hypothetical protein